ncbi:hypothetical protein BP951000_2252 [Brachyspira pilosicoli 95/1000]|uniref:Uncharacterized protein n=1 Tax=Brachyspira pilosicoli (strain ATCC BAA-1826 / 95/1000) TaxID=759914 RepID=D8IA95_BRAP9|nr:hypothetical protein BP951000_2252 [Brachyspira pilosicoli 95/1000]
MRLYIYIKKKSKKLGDIFKLDYIFILICLKNYFEIVFR